MLPQFHRPQPATVISLIALFVALGGSSYAAVQLSKGQVKTKHIAKNAVTTKKVKDGSLLGKDFKVGELPAGEQGPAGPQGLAGAPGQRGPAGPQGAQGPKGDTGAKGETGQTGAKGDTGATGSKGDPGIQGEPGVDGADGAPGPSDAWSASYNDYDYSGNRAISVTVPAGHFVVNAKGSIYSTNGGTGLCTLTGGGGDPLDQAYSHTSAETETTYPVQGVRTFPTGGTLTYECTAPGGTLRAVGWMKLTAIKVGALH
jgi:hypothetical protein